ncbi:MAG: VOC family protein [Betaproteobacteria bacterium]|nr:VOC family protein [Betaproteobacteria bacterium]
MRKIDDVGATFYRAQDLGVPIALTLGRHPNDGMISFYGVTPSGFLIELGVDGREVDDRNWEVKTYNAVSDWGHRPVTTAWIEQLRPGRKSPAVRRELGCAGDGPLVAGRRPSPSLADGSHRAGQSARRLDNHRASPPARGRGTVGTCCPHKHRTILARRRADTPSVLWKGLVQRIDRCASVNRKSAQNRTEVAGGQGPRRKVWLQGRTPGATRKLSRGLQELNRIRQRVE